ncbi:Spy/CpxP family protein refolding chaperone [Rhodobium gokarnense]|uniref:Spy/CpxP family protein refolding chaperone n=1 Tax=Rhodobium gokarnense TaxID=364296 RepID=A0ABT3HGG0_9HYPH|nr:periplasmic heavy metal sensor [Rhodobium gokarnense]MCW2309486.1 Spy/CpxP family protein refolding chaperone [Rhodobium gokarnense]
MGILTRATAAIFGLLMSVPAALANSGLPHAHYAGQQDRAVSTLSAEDIEALKAGAGWGLARPAEFNGYPGPRHILDMADELALSPEQRDEITALFDRMQADAQRLGPDLIAAETALDEAFRAGTIDAETLRARVAAAEEARSRLRVVHMEAHLAATPLLTPHQRHLYNTLRGYAGSAHDMHHPHQ